jgi:hypothetical protein
VHRHHAVRLGIGFGVGGDRIVRGWVFAGEGDDGDPMRRGVSLVRSVVVLMIGSFFSSRSGPSTGLGNSGLSVRPSRSSFPFLRTARRRLHRASAVAVRPGSRPSFG